MKEIEERVLRVHCCTNFALFWHHHQAREMDPSEVPIWGTMFEDFLNNRSPAEFPFREEKKRSEACLSANCWSCLSTVLPRSPGRAKCWCRRRYGISSPGPGLAFEERGLHQLKGVPNEWLVFRALAEREMTISNSVFLGDDTSQQTFLTTLHGCGGGFPLLEPRGERAERHKVTSQRKSPAPRQGLGLKGIQTRCSYRVICVSLMRPSKSDYSQLGGALKISRGMRRVPANTSGTSLTVRRFILPVSNLSRLRSRRGTITTAHSPPCCETMFLGAEG